MEEDLRRFFIICFYDELNSFKGVIKIRINRNYQAYFNSNGAFCALCDDFCDYDAFIILTFLLIVFVFFTFTTLSSASATIS